MRYHIDTIPIWDAFKSGCECPLCAIYEKCEADFVQSSLGGSVMEPDTRIEVNKYGFCNDHLTMLYNLQNRLGLALMMHSHIREIMAEFDKNTDSLLKQVESDMSKGFLERAAGNVTKKAPHIKQADAMADQIVEGVQTCFICRRLSVAMERYVETVIAMWENETEFQKAFSASKGFCLEHCAELLRCGANHLNGKKREAFLTELTRLERENLQRIEGELEWFTLKFDYRNAQKDWGNSRDALERTLLKLRSWKKPKEKK